MNRELKCRAWDTLFKKMVDYIPAQDDENLLEFSTNDRFIVMLSLGRFDKNRKEIFQDDIIIGDWFYTKPTAVDDLRTYYYNDVEFCPAENTEVIGNIHQNPELLNAGK